MTPEMQTVLGIIRSQIAQHGISPTLREIAAIRGLKSASSTMRVVGRLIRDGHLIKVKEARRNLRVVGDGLARFTTEEIRAELGRRGRGGHNG